MSQPVSASVGFVQGAIIAGAIAIGVSFAFPDDGYLATWISSILAGLMVGITSGKPIWDKDSGPTIAVKAVIGPVVLGGANGVFDLSHMLDTFGRIHDLTDGRSEYPSDHWIFVALLGGIWGLLVTVDSRDADKKS